VLDELDELVQRTTQGGFAEQDQLGQTFLLGAPNPALRKSIQVRTARRQLNRFHTASCKRCPKHCAELLVPIMQDEMPLVEISPTLVGRIYEPSVASTLRLDA
jgi:hypothetical protein